MIDSPHEKFNTNWDIYNSIIITPDGKVYSSSFEPLKVFPNNCGYLYVKLSRNHNPTAIHKLVAEKYLKKPEGEGNWVVDHINGDKKDNRVSNLQYITQSENTKKALKRRTIIVEEYE